MPPQLQLQGSNIVLRGHFNPTIFHPTWFASYNLISAQEAEGAEVKIVHPDTTVFATRWLIVNIVRDRFQVATTLDAYYEPLRDLVIGILTLLSHTPLTAIGLNRDFHYRLKSDDARQQVGHRLVPKEDWKSVLWEPVMAHLTVQGKRPDDMDGYIQVEVGPSNEVEHGIYIQVNDHYQLAPKEEAAPKAPDAVHLLSERWNESMQRSQDIAQLIATMGES